VQLSFLFEGGKGHNYHVGKSEKGERGGRGEEEGGWSISYRLLWEREGRKVSLILREPPEEKRMSQEKGKGRKRPSACSADGRGGRKERAIFLMLGGEKEEKKGGEGGQKRQGRGVDQTGRGKQGRGGEGERGLLIYPIPD